MVPTFCPFLHTEQLIGVITSSSSTLSVLSFFLSFFFFLLRLSIVFFGTFFQKKMMAKGGREKRMNRWDPLETAHLCAHNMEVQTYCFGGGTGCSRGSGGGVSNICCFSGFMSLILYCSGGSSSIVRCFAGFTSSSNLHLQTIFCLCGMLFSNGSLGKRNGNISTYINIQTTTHNKWTTARTASASVFASAAAASAAVFALVAAAAAAAAAARADSAFQ